MIFPAVSKSRCIQIGHERRDFVQRENVSESIRVWRMNDLVNANRGSRHFFAESIARA